MSTTAAAADPQTPTCFMRLINEVPSSVALLANNVQIDVQSYHGVGTYTPFPCNASVVVAIVTPLSHGNVQGLQQEAAAAARAETGVDTAAAGGASSVRVWESVQLHTHTHTQVSALSTSHFTAFATLDGPVTRNLQVSILPDIEVKLQDVESGANVDACNLRIVSGHYGHVTVSGIAAECYNCLMPVIASLQPGQATDYMFMSCAYDYSVQAVDGNGTKSTRTYTLLEHGSYTVIVRNSEGANAGESMLGDLVTEVKGRWPFTPIFITMAVLIVLGILHRVFGWILICTRCYAPPPKDKVDVWNIFTVLGYDERIRQAMDKEAESQSATDANDLRSALISTSTGGVARFADQATSQAASDKPTTKPRSSGRIRSIDTLRGACLCIMIFVNYGAGGYQQLDHSKWNGLTLADLVFPIFVWTQGVSMAISFASARRRESSPWGLAQKTVLRALKLYALGLFLNGGGDLGEWRILGVLQYFAVSYFFVGLLEAFFPGSPSTSTDRSAGGSVNGDAEQPEELGHLTYARAFWHDVGRHWFQWLVMLGIGAVYLCVHFLLPVPGCPTGYAGPGGLGDQGAYLNDGCTGGAHRLIDVKVFGLHHIYHQLDANGQVVSAATCASIYDCDVHDPEGMLGWISAAWMTFLGLQAGRVFVNYGRYVKSASDAGERRAAHWAHIARWIIWGIIFGVTGAALAGFSKEDGVIPINKNLWSPSFVFVMAGLGFLGLGAFYFLVDVIHNWSGAPFCYIGMNSILVYAGHEILQGMFPFEFHQGPTWASHAEAIASNVVGVSCWLLIARILYLKKFFVTI